MNEIVIFAFAGACMGLYFALWHGSQISGSRGWAKTGRIFAVPTGIVFLVLSVALGISSMKQERANGVEFQSIRQEIAAMNLGEQGTYFLKKLDPKPSGGIFGGYEDVSIGDARNVLQEARATKQAKK